MSVMNFFMNFFAIQKAYSEFCNVNSFACVVNVLKYSRAIKRIVSRSLFCHHQHHLFLILLLIFIFFK